MRELYQDLELNHTLGSFPKKMIPKIRTYKDIYEAMIQSYHTLTYAPDGLLTLVRLTL